MEIGEKLNVTNRSQWRKWLSKNHSGVHEIWLVIFKKNSGMKNLSYDDAVEGALCYGWIDSIAKQVDDLCYVQRFTPRKKKSVLSETNKERIRRLVSKKKMTKIGLESIKHHILNGNFRLDPDPAGKITR